jgi:hypothetical protein
MLTYATALAHAVASSYVLCTVFRAVNVVVGADVAAAKLQECMLQCCSQLTLVSPHALLCCTVVLHARRDLYSALPMLLSAACAHNLYTMYCSPAAGGAINSQAAFTVLGASFAVSC